MVPIAALFESHLTVSDLQRSKSFYGNVLGLELASEFPERSAAFYWLGPQKKCMLGLWQVAAPLRMNLHLAFTVAVEDLLKAPQTLRSAGVLPLDFNNSPSDEPVVLAWMPAAALYFHDPDGNLLEFIAMLAEPPQPELGVVRWSEWNRDNRSALGSRR
jgi:lactoylglutathione lyase